MYTDAAWVLVSSGTQFQPQIILDPGNLPGYRSVSYNYGSIKRLIQDEVRDICFFFISILNFQMRFGYA